jgi:hypothetical protein
MINEGVTSHSGRKATVSTMRYGGESVEGVTKSGLGLSKKVVQCMIPCNPHGKFPESTPQRQAAP